MIFFGLFKAIFDLFFKTTGISSYFFPRMPMVQHGISVMIFTAVNDATFIVFKNNSGRMVLLILYMIFLDSLGLFLAVFSKQMEY